MDKRVDGALLCIRRLTLVLRPLCQGVKGVAPVPRADAVQPRRVLRVLQSVPG